MNSISWFLYLADVLDGLGTMLGIATVLLMLVTAVSLVGMWFMSTEELARFNNRDGSPDRDSKLAAAWLSRWKAVFSRAWWAFALCAVLSVMVPSRNTMYAIAASQVGEQLASSTAVQGIANDATKALRAWINKQIEPTDAPKKGDGK